MNEVIRELRERFIRLMEQTGSQQQLEELRVAFLGKKGQLTELLKNVGSMSDEEKRTVGREINELKRSFSEMLAQRLESLRAAEMQRQLEAVPVFDMSMPARLQQGSFHPITLVQRELETIFRSMGFTVEDYSEVVTDYECFESLNIPKFHPARDMQDTYYLTNGQLLKTQTSAAQNAIYAWDVAKGKMELVWANGDTDGADGLFDQPSEVLFLPDGQLVVVNIDAPSPGMVNSGADKVHTLSVIAWD